jgi:hypothetical protein
MALDVMTPPLTLLLGLVLMDFLLGAVVAAAVGPWPMGIPLTGLFLLLAASVKSWWTVGRDLLSIGELLRAPAHLFMKLPMYLKFISRRQKQWVRTERHDDKP